MKLICKIISVFTLSCLSLSARHPTIVISGDGNAFHKKVLKHLLKKEYKSLESYVEWRGDCTKDLNEKVFLQLCLKKQKTIVIKSQKKRLKNTISRLMDLEEAQRNQ